MTFIPAVFFFIFGLVIGSFLNVVIYRMNTGKSFGGRSRCMHCRKVLRWYELVPVASFLFLRGRCKECKGRISFQYPVVELCGALVFMGLFLRLSDIFYIDTISFSVVFALYAIVFSLLIVISFYDIRHKVIPDLLVFFLGLFSLASLFLVSGSYLYPHVPSVPELLAGPLAALPFAALFLVSRGRWMGLGDSKLAIGIGWLLGIESTLSSFLIGFSIGAIVGILLVFFRKIGGMKSEIPLAPFLALGAALVFFFGLNFYAFNL